MPHYDYRCTSCEKVFSRILKIAERKEPEADPCPSCETTGTVNIFISAAPPLADPTRLGDVTKIPGGFKDVLRKIHDKVPRSNLNLKYN